MVLIRIWGEGDCGSLFCEAMLGVAGKILGNTLKGLNYWRGVGLVASGKRGN